MLPVALLKEHLDETAIILRAGAAGNALLTLGRTVICFSLKGICTPEDDLAQASVAQWD
jgi:hypothetical protein